MDEIFLWFSNNTSLTYQRQRKVRKGSHWCDGQECMLSYTIFLVTEKSPILQLVTGWCRGSATPPSCPPPATTWWGTTPGWPRCGSTTSPGSRWVQSCRPQCDARWWLFSRCQVIRAWMIIWTLTMRKKMSGLRGTFLFHIYKKFKMFLIQNHTLRLLCCLNQAHASSK